MKRIILALVFGLILCSALDAQIFRRQNCPDGNCNLQPIVVVNPTYPKPVELATAQEVNASDWFKILIDANGKAVTGETEKVIRSYAGRAVRIINGNSCGTGSLVGRDENSIYILTNAHVAGTKIGNVVSVEALTNGKVEKFQAKIVTSAYSNTTSTDWALLAADVKYMAGTEPIKLSTKKPTIDGIWGTWGCPKCLVPRGVSLQPTELGRVMLALPDAIGGQSGSAIIKNNEQVALLTWSMGSSRGRQTGAQLTSEIYRQANEKTIDGVVRFGDMQIPKATFINGVELEEGYHESQEVSKNNRGILDFPIWSPKDGQPQPPVVVPPKPEPPLPPVITPDDPLLRRLIDRLRELRQKEDQKSWEAIILLILQIIELYLKNK